MPAMPAMGLFRLSNARRRSLNVIECRRIVRKSSVGSPESSEWKNPYQDNFRIQRLFAALGQSSAIALRTSRKHQKKPYVRHSNTTA